MALTNDAIFGANQAPYMGADMLNGNAQTSTDWGAVLANGIFGAAQGALGQMVNGAYASGQLLPSPAQQAAIAAQNQQRQMMTMLVIGLAVYLVAKG